MVALVVRIMEAVRDIKMRIFLLFISIAIPCLVYSQTLRKILDRNTELPIPFATIKVVNKPKGVIASQNGEFDLLIEKTDSVLISSVGYHQELLVGERIGNIIYLAPKIIRLQEVRIAKKMFLGTKTIGNKVKTSDNDQNWGPGFMLKEEFAQKIELPDSTRDYRIKKIYIPVKKYVCWGPLLIRIYLADSTSQLPGEEIFVKYVGVDSMTIKNKRVIVDLSNANLYISNSKSFFVSVAWPEDAYYNQCVTSIILFKLSNESTYSRYLASNNYNWFPMGQFKTPDGKTYSAKTAFSIELDELK